MLAPVHPRTRIGAACAVLAALILSAGCGGGAGAAPAPTVDRFDAARAFSDLRMQVDARAAPRGLGGLAHAGRAPAPGAAPRPLLGRCRAGCATWSGSLPGRGRPILVGAHYDTKDIPGFVGANDGAGGVAVVLELARALQSGRRACDRKVRFVMFDGEESPGPLDDGATSCGGALRGSRADAAVTARRTHSMVLVDFVADRDLSIPREAGSDPALWARLRDAADEVGRRPRLPAPRGPGGARRPRALPGARRAGDRPDRLRLPHWHTREDTLDKVSPRSLDAVGETLVAMLRSMARETCAGGAPLPAERARGGPGPGAPPPPRLARKNLGARRR